MQAKENAVPDFDITQFELVDTAILTVQNAKGDDDLIGADRVNPVTIELYGSGSKQMVAALHKAGQKATARMRSLMNGRVNKREAEIAEEENVEKLVALTKAITNLPISPEALYSNPKLGYITRQVQAFINADANFTKDSATS